MSIFGKKTTQSILEAFTADLQEVVSTEAAIAAEEADKIEVAIKKQQAAQAEGGQAQRAIENITALFTEG